MVLQRGGAGSQDFQEARYHSQQAISHYLLPHSSPYRLSVVVRSACSPSVFRHFFGNDLHLSLTLCCPRDPWYVCMLQTSRLRTQLTFLLLQQQWSETSKIPLLLLVFLVSWSKMLHIFPIS